MSFTLEQIFEAQAKVKTGADFPVYAKALADMGVKSYETFVGDGHTVYNGSGNFSLDTGPKDKITKISSRSDTNAFRNALKMHQDGQSDFPTFWRQAAETGVDKWRVDFLQMTCTYFNTSGEKMLVEKIPLP